MAEISFHINNTYI